MALVDAAMDKGLMVRPSGVGGVMNSIFISTATKASKMLVAAASAAVVTGEGEKWQPMDTARHLVMLSIWANVWMLRIITDVFPPPPPVLSLLDFGVEGLVDKKQSCSTAIVLHGGSRGGLGANTTAIGRTLSHILVILNELPRTSIKYEFVLATADRILTENVQLGHAELLEVNRAVLASGFSRTSELLRRALQRSSSITATWPSRVLSLFPLGPRLAAFYDGIRLCLGGLLLPLSAASALRPYKPHSQVEVAGPTASANEWLEAEKLAHELLWITDKLRASSAVGEAIVRWAFASGLASLSLAAHPRVQCPIVKITVLLLRELVRGELEAAREVMFGALALWLPLLCHGLTSPVLMGMEKWEMERVIEDLIAGLPWEDQEIILRNWLEDFSASDSDWPNLSRSFDRWCRCSRKLLVNS